MLVARDAGLAARVDRVAVHPVPQAGFADPEITRGLTDRVSLGNEIQGSTSELRLAAAGISRTPPETIIASTQVSGKPGQAPREINEEIGAGDLISLHHTNDGEWRDARASSRTDHASLRREAPTLRYTGCHGHRTIASANRAISPSSAATSPLSVIACT